MEPVLSRFDWERLIRELDLPSPVKCTAYALATYVDGKTGANGYPGRDNLSRATGLSKPTLTAALAALEAAGLIFRKSHGGGRGVKRAAEYDLAAGATGLSATGETERTVQLVFRAKMDRKRLDSTTSNGVKRLDFAQKRLYSRTKEVVQHNPIMHRSRLTTSSADDPGITAGVEGNPDGLEAHRQAELTRLEAWGDKQYQAEVIRLKARARKQEQIIGAHHLRPDWGDAEITDLIRELVSCN